MPNVIDFISVSKAYGALSILKALSLGIPENKTTALVGESGSGKSSLLQLVNGLLKADAGEIMVLGELVTDDKLVSLRRRMGYAVQGAGLFPHLTVAENISLVARLEGWDQHRIEQRQRQLFDVLELEQQFAQRYPHSLSGGQQQRVSLCRAMMLNPPLLLLDEPFSALDPMTRGSIHAEFQRLRDIEARSILLVTHDMQEALQLAQHIIVLRQGAVVQEGSVAAVQDVPADDYVQTLIDITPA